MYTLINPVTDPSPSLRPVHYVVSFFLLLFSLTCLVILTGIADHPYTASLRSSASSLSSAPSSPLHVLSVPLLAADYPYVAIIDAGSAGSRLYLYHYRWRRGGLQVHIAVDSEGLPIERKIEPGLSFYAAADNYTAAALSLAPLMAHLASRLPQLPSFSSSSSSSSPPRLPLYLFATAGLRLLSAASQRQTLSACVALLPTLLPAVVFPSHHARVITGTEEALYAWLALNYALGTLSAADGQQRRQTAGLVELGGASVQVAFELTDGLMRSMRTEEDEAAGKELQLHPQYTATVHLHLRCASTPSVTVASPPSLPSSAAAAAAPSSALLLADEDDGSSSYHLYVSTYLGYGSNSARQRYLSLLFSAQQHSDPCMLRGNEGSINSGAFKLIGTGQFDDCRAALVPLLNKTAACSLSPCSFNGVHQPQFDSSPVPQAASAGSVSSSSFMPFYGFSELFYTSLHLFNLTGLYSYRTFSTAARAFCSLPYESVVQRYRDGLYGSVDEKRVRQQCFKAAWMSVVLHEGLGFRRGGGDDAAAVAEARQSMDREADMSRREKRREGEIKDVHEAAPTKELVLSPKPADVAVVAAAAAPGTRRLMQAAATVGNDSDAGAALPAADAEAAVQFKPPDSSHGQEAAQPSQLAATASSPLLSADDRQDEELSQPPPPASPPAITPFSPPSQPRLPRHSHSASLTPLARMPDGQEVQWTMGAALTLLSKQIGENPPACEDAQQASGQVVDRADREEAAAGAAAGGGGGGGGVLWVFGRMRRLHVSLVLLLCAATAVLMLTLYGAVWLLDRRRFAHSDASWKKLRRSASANTVSISIRRW